MLHSLNLWSVENHTFLGGIKERKFKRMSSFLPPPSKITWRISLWRLFFLHQGDLSQKMRSLGVLCVPFCKCVSLLQFVMGSFASLVSYYMVWLELKIVTGSETKVMQN